MITLFVLQLAALAAVVGVLGAILWLVVRIILLERSVAHIPGPPRKSFFFGNLSDFKGISDGSTTFGELFMDYHAKYGPLVVIRNLHIAIASVMDPKTVKDVLLDNECLKPMISYQVFVDLFGERFSGHNLVSEINHERWARQRKVFNPAFHRKYLIELMDIFNNSASRLTKFFAAKADGKTEVDMRDAMRRVTLDVIAKAGFSMEQDFIFEDSAFNASIERCFEAALKNAMDLTLKYNPTKSARDYRRETREVIRFLRGMGETLIKQRLADQQAGKALPKDILSFIINTAMVEENMQLVDMVDQFMIFFAAGQETTGNLLAFTLIQLGQHPHIREKLQEEVDRVIGDKDELVFEDLAKLEYMALVFKETLRMFPPVGGTTRISSKPIQCLEYTIPPNVIMQFLTFVMCRQEQFFKNPLTFDPERFRRNEDKPLYSYFPFSLGPRSCIGQQFAMIEAKVVLAKLLQRFKMDFVPGQKIGLRDQLTLCPANDCLHYLTPWK